MKRILVFSLFLLVLLSALFLNVACQSSNSNFSIGDVAGGIALQNVTPTP